MNDLIVIRGGGDIATGIAHRLFKVGFKVAILEIEKPLSIRRKVSFSESIYEGEVVVEGVKAVHAKDIEDAKLEIDKGNIPVLIDGLGESIKELGPMVLVDSILAKKNLGTSKNLAPITIGVGPEFVAGVDVDLVIESMRGHSLGNIIEVGQALANTGVPGSVMGYVEERVVRATSEGVILNLVEIGDYIEKGTEICKIGDDHIYANISGIIRGLIRNGIHVREGLKIGDIDPRGVKEYAFTISDKARAIAGSVLGGIIYLQNKKAKAS